MSAVATLPALFVALLAAPFGVLGDRIGHKRVLFLATLLYGFVGIAPLWLPSLQSIVVSRAVVGVAEAAIMTCSTALIGAYFVGSERERYLALQTGTAPIVAFIVTKLGGVLGEQGWREPFWIYGFGFMLVPLTGVLLWESYVGRRGLPVEPALAAGPDAVTTVEAEAPLQMRSLLWVCVVTVFGLSAFLVTAIQSSYLVAERGLTSPQQIGTWVSLAMLANPVGAVAFRLLPARLMGKLALAFALMCTGQAVMALSESWQAAIGGAALANLGAGMILPTLITWALADVPAVHQGRGSGIWMAASFLGQFISPFSIVKLKQLTGSLSHAILVYALACAVACLLTLPAVLKGRR
ncbi:MAG: MFS transporter [Steroidobacteraceae bacterium]